MTMFVLEDTLENHQKEIEFLHQEFLEETNGMSQMNLIRGIHRYMEFLSDQGEIDSTFHINNALRALETCKKERYNDILSDDCLK
jgi:hypothetical protein